MLLMSKGEKQLALMLIGSVAPSTLMLNLSLDFILNYFAAVFTKRTFSLVSCKMTTPSFILLSI